MGSVSFYMNVKGATANEAFKKAKEAVDMNGDSRGTIAMKTSFTQFPAPGPGQDLYDYVDTILERPRISSTSGPAGCIHLGGDEWAFFGWARE